MDKGSRERSMFLFFSFVFFNVWDQSMFEHRWKEEFEDEVRGVSLGLENWKEEKSLKSIRWQSPKNGCPEMGVGLGLGK